jgi:Ham1 family
MTRPLVFATRNPGKLAELRELLPELRVIDVDEAARQLGREIPDVEEDADTFVGNAVKKAREVSAATGLPALADDSGLLVDALGGAPGVLSARYAGPGAAAAANNARGRGRAARPAHARRDHRRGHLRGLDRARAARCRGLRLRSAVPAARSRLHHGRARSRREARALPPRPRRARAPTPTPGVPRGPRLAACLARPHSRPVTVAASALDASCSRA